MPARIYDAAERTIAAERLTPGAFAPFGTVIQNPSRATFPWPVESVQANQGSATKYVDVSGLISSYELARSGKPAVPRLSMFSSRPRQLRKDINGKYILDVGILERHPFTPQTFVPLGLAADNKDTRFLVIVAPTLPLTRASAINDEFRSANPPPYPPPDRQARPTLKQRLLGGRPNLYANDHRLRTTPTSLYADNPTAATTITPKPPGPPDLANLRAFIATGDQAVTYGAGTWHAPMVVINNPVDFVVAQFMNGVGPEDCQEVELYGGKVSVELGDELFQSPQKSKL